MKTSTFKTEVLHLSRKPVQFSLQVGSVSLKQVKEFKYLGVAFTCDGRQDEKLDARSDKASTVMRTLHHSIVLKRELAVMRTLHHSIVLKRELTREAKLSVFKLIFVPILTYGNESWIMTARLRSQMQASETRFLQKINKLNIVTLQFDNLSTSRRYFSGSKDLSFNGLTMRTECFRNGFPSKLYMLK